MTNYQYIIGSNPYDNRQAWRTRGNGEWSAQAPNVKEALRIIFSSMMFPSEATGRQDFVSGVSLEGKHEDDIIQVWSDDPAGFEKGKKRRHDGRGTDLALLMEIEVEKIGEFITPIAALLTGPKSDTPHVSPLGASMIQFDQTRFAVQQEMQAHKFEVQRKKWEVDNLKDAMEQKMGLMKAQIGILDTYIHGTRNRHQISTGKLGSGPYHVYQNRQFLSEEIGLMANFQDMDFSNLEDLEKWLVKSGHVWKFLPHERCILATRTRKENKEYGDPISNWINNELNMQNMIWIRDGENVFHVDIDFHLGNVVFPDKNQYDQTFQRCRDYIWSERFKVKSEPSRWLGRQYDGFPMGQIKPVHSRDWREDEKFHPEDEYCPYTEVRNHHLYATLEDWLASESYTQSMEGQLRDAVNDYLAKNNREHMRFCVLLQGIVDNTNMLQIPKGTDLFRWDSIAQYFVILQDYSHGLPDHTYANKIAEYFDASKVRVNDWVIAFIDDSPDTSYGRTGNPWLLQVIAMSAEGKPVVKWHPRLRRHRSYYSETKQPDRFDSNNRKLQSERLVLSTEHISKTPRCTAIVRVPIPSELVEKILDDRAWKKKHRESVGFLAQYKNVQRKFLRNMENMTYINLELRTDYVP